MKHEILFFQILNFCRVVELMEKMISKNDYENIEQFYREANAIMKLCLAEMDYINDNIECSVRSDLSCYSNRYKDILVKMSEYFSDDIN